MHKFKVGQRVRFSGARLFERGATIYSIVAHLPDERGDLQYRIRSAENLRERVVTESQLSAATAG